MVARQSLREIRGSRIFAPSAGAAEVVGPGAAAGDGRGPRPRGFHLGAWAHGHARSPPGGAAAASVRDVSPRPASMHRMGDLREAIKALKAGLGDMDATITLGVSPARDAEGSWTWNLATTPSPHSIVLRHGKARPQETVMAPEEPLPRSEEERHAEALAQLDQVFGTPGFDSGARASVFRELAEGLRDEGFVQVLDCLQRGQPATEPPLERARHGLVRLLERGPSGVRGGCAILRGVHSSHGLAGILALVGSRWRFGD